MGKLKCSECGQVFDSSLNECPNCACPASECEAVSETINNQTESSRDMGLVHNNFNEQTPYSPFSTDYVMFKDPKLLAKYPIGELAKKHPFWGWLLGPWHLTCKDENSREQYDVINNIFYGFNVLWKAIAYSVIWTLLKTWVIIALYIAVFVMIVNLSSSYEATQAVALVGTVLYVYLMFVYIFGVGKSLHRYWPQFHKVLRRLCKRFVNAMKN